MTFGKSRPTFDCSFSICETDKLLKEIHRLPDSPTGLRVYLQGDKSPRSFRVEWNYQDLGFPCQFLIEHRTKGSSDTWTGQKTGKHQLAIPFQVGLALEIRIAAETCIGRSEFCPVVDMESATEEDNLEEEKETCLSPPAGLLVASVTHNMAELRWTAPSSGDFQMWRTVWREGRIPLRELCEPLGQSSCLVENLEPECTQRCCQIYH